MSREIKYKIWDKENSEWYKPTFEAYKGKLEHLVLNPDGSLSMITINEKIHESMFPDRFEVVLYSGLKDKNGVEIYRGYILFDSHNEEYGEVVFQEGEFCVEWETLVDDLYENCDVLEVSGNIYQNPELLEGSND